MQIGLGKISKKLQKILKNSSDLLAKKEVNRQVKEGKFNEFDGHCYIAAEALYHILAEFGIKSKSYVIPKKVLGSTTHWFLIVDPTDKQFLGKIPYDKAKGCGFLTKKPSKRCKELMRRMK